MRPMNDASFRVPFVFAVERDGISFAEGREPGCEVDVVSNQERLPGRQFQEKALMAAPFIVIRQDLDDDPAAFGLNTALAFIQRNGHGLAASGRAAGGFF